MGGRGVFVFHPDGEESAAPVCFWSGGGGGGLSVVWSTRGPFEELQPISTRMRIEECDLKRRKFAQGVRT